MKTTIKILIIAFLLVGCKKKISYAQEVQEEAAYRQELAVELYKMAEVDQIAAHVPQGEHKKWSNEKWDSYKDSIFRTHQKRLKQIFDKHGFVGFDLAGEEGSQNFWLMVQHSDHDPVFQNEVLEKMKIAVDNGNAKPTHYGLLLDRVRLNTGKKQVYGTQVTYNLDTGQAYPKSLEDSLKVNERRESIELEPIEEYLNRMTIMHFELNKKKYLRRGVTEPRLYNIK